MGHCKQIDTAKFLTVIESDYDVTWESFGNIREHSTTLSISLSQLCSIPERLLTGAVNSHVY